MVISDAENLLLYLLAFLMSSLGECLFKNFAYILIGFFLNYMNSLYILDVVQLLSCDWLCDPMDCSMPGSSALHCLLEFAQIL